MEGGVFLNHLHACMCHLVFVLCSADTDVWMYPAHKSDGLEYYEYALLYIDFLLEVSEHGEKVLQEGIG